MPDYTIRIKTNAVLDRKGLDVLEDVVYDTIVDKFGGSTELDHNLVGLTDVEAVFN